MNTERSVTVNSLNYDLSVRKSWCADLIKRSADLLVLEGIFDADVEHPELGRIDSGTVSIEYYWLNCWYNIFRFHAPDGELRNYYCNVNMPPRFTGVALDYIDLDLDIVVWPEGPYYILDFEEFEDNARRFAYPESVRKRAKLALDELVSLIESNGLPS